MVLDVTVALEVAGAALGATVVAGAGAAGWWARRSRAAFDRDVADWRQRIEQAEARLAEFRVDQDTHDRIVALKLKGQATTALAERVTGALDAITTGITALKRHVATCEQRAAAVPWWATRRLDLLRVELAGSIEVEVESDPRLFSSGRVVTASDVTVFARQLAEEFATARAQWQRVLDAVATSLRSARQDLPPDELDRLRRALERCGLPERWVHAHPLARDPETAWSRLDDTRRADPVAYLDEIERAYRTQGKLATAIDAVTSAWDLVHIARSDGLATLRATACDTVVTAPDVDPRAAEAAAVLATVAVAEAEDADAALPAIETALVAWDAVAESSRTLAAIVEAAPAEVADAKAMVATLRGRVEEARAAVAGLRGHDPDTLQGAWSEVDQALVDVAEAEAAAAAAEQHLGRREHAAAVRMARVAMREHGEAVEDLADAANIVAALASVQSDARRLRDEIDARRAQMAAALAAFGPFGEARLLDAGDRRLAELRSEWEADDDSGRPVSWPKRLAEVKSVIAAWHAGVRVAETEWDARNARIAEADEARRQLAAERGRNYAEERPVANPYASFEVPMRYEKALLDPRDLFVFPSGRASGWEAPVGEPREDT
jgi:hypothetical protein